MFKIAVLPGDGIGPEVMAEALKVLEVVGEKYGHEFSFQEGFIGGAAYDETGEHFPKETLELCQSSDAVLFSAVGGPVDKQNEPKWKDAERNAILGMRKALELRINLRPAVVFPFLSHLSPLKPHIIEKGVDLLIVRELISDVYFGEHKTEKTPQGLKATDLMQYGEWEIAPVIHFACKAAQKRKKNVTVVDKANVLDTSRLWRKVAEDIIKQYPDVTLEYLFIDNAVVQVIKNPSSLDVVATANLFGDILSDAASVLPGSLGLMPSASLGEKIHLFEPIGGSAPRKAGQGTANPIAQILSAALMLRYSFGLEEEAKAIENAVQSVLQDGYRTIDLVQEGQIPIGTKEMGDRIVAAL